MIRREGLRVRHEMENRSVKDLLWMVYAKKSRG